VKYDFAPNLFGLGELYSVAYTQHSFWQYYVGDAYFRASDYNPEFYITVPLKTEYVKAVRLAFAHKSNGLGVPNERAWNYTTLYTYFQYKTIFTELALWYRFPDNYDYNPGLIDTMGNGHVKFLIPYEKHLLTTLFRNNFKGKGAIDTEYSYPLFGESLFLYVKGFVGYGESMSSYAGNPDYAGLTPQQDDYVEKIAVGFSLSR
jgi:phospholipase A1